MNQRPTIFLFADVLGGFGGIETYLDALARRLWAEDWPVRIAVSLNAPAPFLDQIELLGVPVYRQPRIPGDRYCVRQRLLARYIARQVKPGDWVYCVRQPMGRVYLPLVRAVHARGGKVAASWMFAPEFLPASEDRLGAAFKQAVSETDVVISVSECTKGQFAEIYGYAGPVSVVRYHNVLLMQEVVPLPPMPPLGVGYLGRIDIRQKNLDTILEACRIVAARRTDVVFNFHGGGSDLERFLGLVATLGLADRVTVHGPYSHVCDLVPIVAQNHLFIYPSRYEGGPCFSLLELLQAGRFVIASSVGGIPDIYRDRPHVGTLVDAASPQSIAEAILDAIDELLGGKIDSNRIRDVYEAHFTDEVAHSQWLRALRLC